MALNFSLTSLHVAISIIAILTGIALVAGLVANRHQPAIAALFLSTTLLTTLTGYLFPATTITPAHVFGAISIVALTIAIASLYWRRLHGGWRTAYVVMSMLAFYLNAFVGVVQAFQKVAGLHRLAPTQSEPPFVIAQSLLLFAFIISGWIVLKRFRVAPT